MNQQVWEPTTEGRYPATLLHDGSDAVTAEFPVTGASDGLKNRPGDIKSAGQSMGVFINEDTKFGGFADSGSASRYFTSAPYEPGELDSLVPFLYCAKASTAERNAGLTNEPQNGGFMRGTEGRFSGDMPKARNFHPTCKPIRLMEWLCNLLCPPGGLILDPFMGSGTTGIAAGRNGFDFIGCELDPGYFELCPQRIAHWTHYRPELKKVSNPIPLQPTNTPTLF